MSQEVESAKGQKTGRLAWSLALFAIGGSLVAFAIGIFFLITTGGSRTVTLDDFLIPIPTAAYAIVGGVVASRQPRNLIGWIFIAVSWLYGISLAKDVYQAFGPEMGVTGSVPALARNLWIPRVLLPTLFVFLLFPDGLPLSRRWGIIFWLAASGLVAQHIALALHPGPVPLYDIAVNPDGFPALAGMLDMVLQVTRLLLVIGLVGAIAAFVIRLRRSRGVERQQMKWLSYAICLALLSFAFGTLTWSLWSDNPLVTGLSYFITEITVLGIAVAAGIAILRHRLYDIDLIINRTLVYGALTAGVAGLYVLMVGGVGLALQSNSNLAAALLTTSLVVTLFKPLHNRLQQRVDRFVPVGRTYPNPQASAMEKHPDRTLDERQKKFQEPVRENKVDYRAIRLPARMRPFLRTMWFLGATVVLGIIILNVPSQINAIAETAPGELTAAAPFWLVAAVNIAPNVAQPALLLLSLILAGVLYVKRPKDGVALFLSYFLLVNGVVAAPLSFLEPFLPGANALPYSVIQPLIFCPLLIAFLSTFPNGRLVPSWTRWLIIATIIYAPVSTIFLMTQTYSKPTPIYITGVLTWFLLIFTGFYTQIYRYFRVSNPIERQQTKWVLYGFTIMTLFASLTTTWTIINHSQPQRIPLPWWSPLINLGWVLAYATLPITLTFAVMRYRLFDIDFIINRTLVYGTLTACVVGLYVLLVGALGTFFQTQGNLIIALLATGIVAALFQLLRERLQRGVNRLIYGERDDPVETLSRLGRQLETAVPTDKVLPTLVETIAQTLKLPYVAIHLPLQEGDKIAALSGNLVSELVQFPLVHQGEDTGQLVVGLRSPGSPFSPAEMRLLRNIARQAGTAVHAVQLTTDLQRSRQNLVTAREDERLRLRRDLHDGLGPALASVIWQVDSARDMIPTNPSEAVQMLESSIGQAQAALADIRRLVYGLRPPALDELGLVGALEQSVRQHPQISVTVEAPAPFPSLPAAVEVAAYRIVQEALKNAVEHGKAKNCVVSLALENGLCLTVRDDGLGLPKMVSPGVGLFSMRERAEELGGVCTLHPRPGGGTAVEVSLPLE
jgi:signal transduction histidine kinase